MKVRSNIKAGIVTANHNEKAIKVKSGVKAGAAINHNEKTMSDNNESIVRKSFSKMLNLKKETIRELKESQLKAIAGGAMPPCASEEKCCKD